MKTGLHDELAKEVLVTSVSSLGSALTQYQSPISSLDKNGDGIISADELAAANISTGASTTATSTAKASSTSTDDDSGSTTDVVQRITADILNMMLQMQQQSDSGTSSDDSSDGTDAASGPQGVLASLDANGDGQLTTSEILSGDTQALAGNASGDDDDQFLTNILSDIQKSQQAYQNTYGSSPAADTADTQGEIQAI
jgi:hypothetical protein